MAVIAAKDSPIASIKDLAGKRVAIWPATAGDFGTDAHAARIAAQE